MEVKIILMGGGMGRLNVCFYNENKERVLDSAGHDLNGYAVLDTEEGYTPIIWGGWYKVRPDVEYIRFYFENSDGNVLGEYNVKNIKVTSKGNYSNFTKTITATASDDKGISSLKWLKGEQTEEAFETGGTEFKDSFDVEENDVYTVCATDSSGNKTVKKITISGIEEENV